MKSTVQHINTKRFFVKLPRYVAQWLRTKYMSSTDKHSPIVLPWRACKAGEIVYKYAVSNAEIKKLTPMCYSSQMFNMDPGDVPQERQDDFPSDESMRDFIAIALPDPHYFEGVWISDDETMQLNQHHTKEFIDVIIAEFWSDYDKYLADAKAAFLIKHPDRHCSVYDCMLDFMEFWQINLDNEEAFYRASMRRNASNKKAI